MTDNTKNLKVQELVRGSTPEEIESKCLSLCKLFIGGPWNNVTSVDDVHVKRITGGLTNQLYYIELDQSFNYDVDRFDYDLEIQSNQPTVVTVKFHQDKLFKTSYYNDERIPDTIITSILSELGLGPKTFGIFNGGVVQAFYKHVQFRQEQQQNRKLLRQLAHTLAKINLLNIPIPKNRDWLINQIQINSSSEKFDQILYEKICVQCNEWQVDLNSEVNELNKQITEFQAPNVFCHNDFRGSNILVTDPEQKLMIIDYEYCAYGPRGFDIGVFLTEWDSEILQMKSLERITDDVIERFVRYYLEGCNILLPGFSNQPGNSVSDIIRETKFGILCNMMFFVTIMVNYKFEVDNFDDNFKLEYTQYHLKNYLQLKRKLIQEGIINAKSIK